MDLLKEYEIKQPGRVVKDDDPNNVLSAIEDLGLTYFDDGLLGSTGHGVGYYYHDAGKNANEFIGKFTDVEDKLRSRTIDKEYWEDNEDVNEKAVDDFFRKYKGTHIIKGGDDTNYGRVDVNSADQTITIYALPLNADGIEVIEFNNNGTQLKLNPKVNDYTIDG